MISLFFPLLVAISFAFDPSVPHSHTGKVIPMKKAPAAVPLTVEQKNALSKGNPIFMRVRTGEERGKGVAVQYIHASDQKVWDTILDYPKYPQWVDNVS